MTRTGTEPKFWTTTVSASMFCTPSDVECCATRPESWRWGVGSGEREMREREAREKKEVTRAWRSTPPHAVGYVGERGQVGYLRERAVGRVRHVRPEPHVEAGRGGAGWWLDCFPALAGDPLETLPPTPQTLLQLRSLYQDQC